MRHERTTDGAITEPGASTAVRGAHLRPLVSVVIPTRNRLEYLQEAVSSVEGQTFGDWELLITDDASEDETPRWLRTLTRPRIRVLTFDHHRHRAAARNAGLAEARGAYVIFLDDDDRFRPRALEALADALEDEPVAPAACGGRVTFDDEGNRRPYPHVRRAHLRVLWPQVIAGWIPGTGSTMFRTEVLRSLGGWDESLIVLQDWELGLRVARVGPLHLIPYKVLEYRRHPGQWYTRDPLEARDRILRSFVESLPDRDRNIAADAIRTRDALQAARERLHMRGDPRGALRLFVAAYRSSPDVVRSPMFRLSFIRGVSQASLAWLGGRHTHRAIESTRQAVLRILRRRPGYAYPRRPVQDRTFRDDR